MNSSTNFNPDFHLGVIRFLDKVHAMSGVYCHFKSNEHVAEGMRGDTDLDILVARKYRADIVAALGTAGFKVFYSGSMTRYSAVEDWIGCDPETGRMAHLHIHWQMIAGEPYLKGYRIPWERRILDTRVWCDDLGIFTAAPEMELLLLVSRAALKYRLRSFFKAAFGKPVFASDFCREHTWLLDRVDPARVRELARSLFPEHLAATMVNFALNCDSSPTDLAQLQRAVARHFAPWRSYGPLPARILRWQREAWRRVIVRLLRLMGEMPLARRAPATGGLIVALVGADGSGKSTQAEELERWLGWKVDVCRVYFGSGDGPMSWHRAALLWLQNRFGRSRQRKGVSEINPMSPSKTFSSPPEELNTIQHTFRGLYSLSLAAEKHSTIRRATRARNRGMIVVCDRYPQNQIAGYNDGPLLTDWAGSKAPWSIFSQLERHLLSVFSSVSPDLVIKLSVSKEVSAARKADTPMEMIEKKITAVRGLSFGAECQVIELNADQSLEAISLAIRTNVWNIL